MEGVSLKLLIVGFDAAHYFTIKKHGFFKEWRNKSNWGCLKSIHSNDGLPHTGPMWSTIYTGVTPGKHGIVTGGWLLEHKNWGDLKVSTVFEERQDLRWGLMTLPLTYPANGRSVNGWVVSGFPVPNKEVATGLRSVGVDESLVTDFCPDVLNNYEDLKGLSGKEKEEFILEKGLEVDRSKLDLAKKLPGVDVLFFGFMQLDRMGHFGSEKSFLESYRKSEILLKDTFDAFKPDEMLIVSDHGMSINFCRHNTDGFWLHWKDDGKLSEEQDVEKSIVGVKKMIERILGDGVNGDA